MRLRVLCAGALVSFCLGVGCGAKGDKKNTPPLSPTAEAMATDLRLSVDELVHLCSQVERLANQVAMLKDEQPSQEEGGISEVEVVLRDVHYYVLEKREFLKGRLGDLEGMLRGPEAD